ncbi:TPA: IS30 family transposase [Staphylococcus aureus]|uniref:IS30 family transposase n=1 Tax=Staphylococcus aureus TaxID=1280 RepID=UPI0009917851|nr:IS30 family transposase [Staphylococcus aureus]HCG2568892.1 IS30 family transposase [Staphylococcus aureus]HCV2304559.1 IS30 family transposase [Staphylococcus aureus]HCX0881246.1 IS30 family transposase [Staphylococcus aureus]HCX1098478.1 IS30 family transposase [Staphylococcus aureus]
MEVVKREEFGHYEIDTIWSKRPSRYCLLTILERKTRFLYAKILPTRRSDVVCSTIVEILEQENVKTITIDRGKEFAKFELIERELNCSVYFSDPGCPYQRGSIEQVNGLLRQYFPKDTDFVNVSDIDVEIAVLQINQRPRMKQNYKTSEHMRMLEYN